MSERREGEVLEEMLDDRVPEAEDQLRVDGDELGTHQLEDGPKGTTRVSLVTITYRLPVLSLLGLRSRSLTKANASSMGAAEYE